MNCGSSELCCKCKRYIGFQTLLMQKIRKQPTSFKLYFGDFLSGPVVKSPPCNAGNVGSISGQGASIPHASGQLSPWATTTELARLNKRPCAANYRPHALWNPRTTITEPMRPGARAPQLERSPRTKTKSPSAATKDPACLSEDPVCCS